jgi:hypothetical protein
VDSTNTPAELAYLLDLAARRTPGQIRARAASLQLGSNQIDGFPQAVDAAYLAQAATVLPKLVAQLLSIREVVREQVEEISALQLQVASVQQQLETTYKERELVRATLRRARRQIRRLKRQTNSKPKVIRVSTPPKEVVYYRTVKAPASWLAPDGHQYELVYAPQQPEGADSLPD